MTSYLTCTHCKIGNGLSCTGHLCISQLKIPFFPCDSRPTEINLVNMISCFFGVECMTLHNLYFCCLYSTTCSLFCFDGYYAQTLAAICCLSEILVWFLNVSHILYIIFSYVIFLFLLYCFVVSRLCILLHYKSQRWNSFELNLAGGKDCVLLDINIVGL